MTTPINIISLDQGKGLYNDWTLETVDEEASRWAAVIDMLALVWSRLPARSSPSGAGATIMVPGE